MVKRTAQKLPRRTPIEKIFREIVGREMSPKERRILLRNPRKEKAKTS